MSPSPAAAFRPAKTEARGPQFLQIVAKREPKLTRVAFKISRLMEFCNERELTNQTGHSAYEWPLVIEGVAIPSTPARPRSRNRDRGRQDGIVIEDNAGGIDAGTVESVSTIRFGVSSREAYVSPTKARKATRSCASACARVRFTPTTASPSSDRWSPEGELPTTSTSECRRSTPLRCWYWKVARIAAARRAKGRAFQHARSPDDSRDRCGSLTFGFGVMVAHRLYSQPSSRQAAASRNHRGRASEGPLSRARRQSGHFPIPATQRRERRHSLCRVRLQALNRTRAPQRFAIALYSHRANFSAAIDNPFRRFGSTGEGSKAHARVAPIPISRISPSTPRALQFPTAQVFDHPHRRR